MPIKDELSTALVSKSLGIQLGGLRSTRVACQSSGQEKLGINRL